MQKYVQEPYKTWDILKGDNVIINAGKDKGKTGKVLRVYRSNNRILVQDINIKMKRVKATEEAPGSIKQIINSIHVSNANLVDPETGKAARIKYGFLEDGKKVRISKKSGSIIKKPEFQDYMSKQKDKIDGLKDTDPQTTMAITYLGEDFAKIQNEFLNFIQSKENKEKLLIFNE